MTHKFIQIGSLIALGIGANAQTKTAVTIGNNNAFVYDLKVQSSAGLLEATLGDRIEIWNYKKQALLKSWPVEKIISIDVFEPYIAGVSKNGFLWIWNTGSGEEIGKFKLADSPLTCVRWVNSKNILVGSDSGALLKLNVPSGRVDYIISGGATITAFSNLLSDGTTMFSANADGELLSLDLANGKVVFKEKIHKGWVRSLKIGGLTKGELISTGDDRYIKEWNIGKGAITLFKKRRMANWVTASDIYQEDDRHPVLLASGLKNGSISLSFYGSEYRTSLHAIINNIFVVKQDSTFFSLIVGTHGRGIKLIPTSTMKLGRLK